jgi:hypothetical protein
MNGLPIPIPTDIPLMAIPKVIAGFLYGMTLDSNLKEIEACFNSTKFVMP